MAVRRIRWRIMMRRCTGLVISAIVRGVGAHKSPIDSVVDLLDQVARRRDPELALRPSAVRDGARLVGRTEDWLSRVENGKIELDRLSVIRRLAEAWTSRSVTSSATRRCWTGRWTVASAPCPHFAQRLWTTDRSRPYSPSAARSTSRPAGRAWCGIRLHEASQRQRCTTQRIRSPLVWRLTASGDRRYSAPARPRSGHLQAVERPNFETKVADVVGLYLDPPVGAVVLSIDEKTRAPRSADGSRAG